MCLSRHCLWGTAGLGRCFIRSFTSPNNLWVSPVSLDVSCAAFALWDGIVTWRWEIACVWLSTCFIFILTLPFWLFPAVEGELVLVCQFLNHVWGVQTYGIMASERILTAWSVACTTYWWHWRSSPAVWIPGSVPVPAPLDCQCRDYGNAAASPAQKCVICVCSASRARVCWLFLLLTKVTCYLDVSSLARGEFAQLHANVLFARLLCFAPYPVTGRFLDKKCVLLS